VICTGSAEYNASLNKTQTGTCYWLSQLEAFVGTQPALRSTSRVAMEVEWLGVGLSVSRPGCFVLIRAFGV
jgi:hypothetical protein